MAMSGLKGPGDMLGGVSRVTAHGRIMARVWLYRKAMREAGGDRYQGTALYAQYCELLGLGRSFQEYADLYEADKRQAREDEAEARRLRARGL